MLGADVLDRPGGVLVCVADMRPGFVGRFWHLVVLWDLTAGESTRARAIARAGKRARSEAKAAAVPRRQWWENAPLLADQRHAVKDYIQGG